MKRCWKKFALIAVVILVGSSSFTWRNLPASIAGAASGEAAGPHSRTGSSVAIRIFQFQPRQVEVTAGATVTWMNDDDITHTVTSGAPEKPDGRWDVALSGRGATTSVAFDQPGEYEYFCGRHRFMRGSIRVK